MNRKVISEMRAGFKSGLLHNENIPLHRQNEDKMNMALRTEYASDLLVFAYWSGYKMGIFSRNKQQSIDRNWS